MTTLIKLLGLAAMANTLLAATLTIETKSGFRPTKANIRIGDTVEFANTSGIDHTVTADPSLAANPANVILPVGATPFHSGILQPGDVFRQTFTVSGHYQYVCLKHETMGMIGQIDVDSSDLDEELGE